MGHRQVRVYSARGPGGLLARGTLARTKGNGLGGGQGADAKQLAQQLRLSEPW